MILPFFLNAVANTPAEPAPGPSLDSLFDMVVAGGPMMIPIGLCSVIALAYAVERSMRLTAQRLGTHSFGQSVVDAFKNESAEKAIQICDEEKSPMAHILAEGLKRVTQSTLDREKAVEDAGAREVKRLSANLRPLVVVGMIAPLLGLLGTVWGMIDAFKNVALNEGLGKPELLAAGISQALVTTAAGLAIAIPTQAAYFYFRSKIDRFTARTEDYFVQISDTILERS
jgi:biopolymer transport protein ExbB